jgi:hypothetical protein
VYEVDQLREDQKGGEGRRVLAKDRKADWASWCSE